MQELQHLFDKLDVDSDGRVSFHEFLHGLFTHGGPSTPSATPVRPQSTPRQKLKLAVIATFEDRPQTPSFIASISGLFSTIDPEGTGYVICFAMCFITILLMMRGDDNIIFLSPGCTGCTGKMAKNIPCQGKHRAFWKFILPKHREFWFVQVVNSLILRVKDISIFAMKILNIFFTVDKSAKSVLCM